MSAPAAVTPAGARIGPNTIIQVAGVLRDRLSPTFADAVLHDATRYTLATLPSQMIDEREAQRVVRALVTRIGAPVATGMLREAGHRTGAYLLANRIPLLAQWIMRAAPRRMALSLLLRAMRANAWTFAGSGRFSVELHARTPALTFAECTMCRGMHETMPMCDFYGGTFEHLIHALVTPAVQVVEVTCMAQGAACCRFELQNL